MLHRLEEKRDAIMRQLRKNDLSWREVTRLNEALDAVCDEIERLTDGHHAV